MRSLLILLPMLISASSYALDATIGIINESGHTIHIAQPKGSKNNYNNKFTPISPWIGDRWVNSTFTIDKHDTSLHVLGTVDQENLTYNMNVNFISAVSSDPNLVAFSFVIPENVSTKYRPSFKSYRHDISAFFTDMPNFQHGELIILHHVS